jgi:hydrogenase nickel incorporation protein HypB
MCATCGCSEHTHAGFDQAHHHHDHHHDHHLLHADARGPAPRTIDLERAVLEKNDRRARENRRRLADERVLALNLVSSPGAGKTTLLERTISDLKTELTMQVIEGDQATSHDADRIRAAGSQAVQINTGTGCHLDAEMVDRGLRQLAPPSGAVVFIENVGNLVCPALFDLGEQGKVVIASVTEGDDKPLKYPHVFRAGQLVLLNKLDLIPHVLFDVDRFTHNVRQVNPALLVIAVSALRGDGLPDWYSWLRSAHARA